MKEDYFNSDLEQEASLLPTTSEGPTEDADINVPTAPRHPPKKRQVLGYDLSTLLMASAAVVVLAVYAAWPDSPPSRAFIPDEGTAQVTQHPSITSPSQPEHRVSEEQLTVAIPPPATPQAAETEEIRQYSAANREAITVLNGRTGNIEQRLATLETQLRTLATQPTTPPPSPPSTPRVKPAARITSGTAGNAGLKSWRIHTLYPGMAWITHDGSTWAVQAGDRLQGITILSIDNQHRVVMTDKGVIRQGD
ncbi:MULTISPECIES: hypothetical protein [unclassified Serratia (in: enterobacteria)]|uniref:hypothetical protein n=1 Tax=unclassified Serratia (in: enterobacteria) TaxID=2647522 RepID=UPI0030760AC4